MIKITDHEPGSAAHQLRELADRIDETGDGDAVVCIIGRGMGARVYVLGGDIGPLLTATSTLLEGIVESLPMANQSQH